MEKNHQLRNRHLSASFTDLLHANHTIADKSCSLLLTQVLNIMRIPCLNQEFIVMGSGGRFIYVHCPYGVTVAHP